jgi:hypothetical protein
MAYTTIDDPSAYFQTALYTGTGSDNAITNSGNSNLQPDWLWIKNRGATQDHIVFDTSRGFNGDNDSLYLEPNNNDAESHNDNDHVKSFNSDGFTMQGGSGRDNNNTTNYVAWQWKANGGTTSSNSDGSITSTVQANTTAGFSIVTYTGTGSAATIGHGLGAEPDMVIIKSRSNAVEWQVYLKSFGNDDTGLFLDTTDAATSATNYYNNGGTSSVFGVSNNTGVGTNTYTYVAYCFRNIQGYSKIGKYKGNNNADGTFVYTGFKPALLILKNIDDAVDWYIFDNKRDTDNVVQNILHPNKNDAASDSAVCDFLSNGFKFRTADNAWNGNGDSYIYMAFAESPFVSSKGVPTTAG